MAKKVLTIEQKEKKRWIKLRAAIRNVWQYDYVRKAVIDAAIIDDQYNLHITTGEKMFTCPICLKYWPIELATVDHEPELGGFASFKEFGEWVERCFNGPQRAICKPCHKRKKRPSRKSKGAKQCS
jgi:hypothetical protein